MGLFVMEFDDAIHEGDGYVFCIVGDIFLIFYATKRHNYSIEAFRLLAQHEYTLSPRMAQQLIWSRTV